MPALEKKAILVVEDEPIVGLEISEDLERSGYRVPEVVPNGNDVMDAIERCRPDLILMDIRIEGALDGIEIARRVKANFDLPILFLTAYSDRETVARAAKTMPDAYLLKPLDIGELLANVEVALHKSSSATNTGRDLGRFVAVVDALPDPVVLFDDIGRLFHLNPVARIVLNIPDESGFSGFELSDFIADGAGAGQLGSSGIHEASKTFFRGKSFLLRLEDIKDKKGLKLGTICVMERAEAEDRKFLYDSAEAVEKAIKDLVPTDGAFLPAFNTAGFVVPYRSGLGDFYDIFPLNKLRFLFYAVDVMGHGMLPSLIVYSLYDMVRVHTQILLKEKSASLSPNDIASELNRRFFPKVEGTAFFTMLVGIVDTRSRQYSFVRAGHPYPLLQQANGECLILKSGGMALGAFGDIQLEEFRGKLAKGERLIMPSDGMMESLGFGDIDAAYVALSELCGEHRRLPLSHFVSTVKTALENKTGKQGDDMSMVVIEIP